MATFHGSCHCGTVQFEVDAQPTGLSQCNCSICFAKGALYIPVAEISDLRIISGESELTPYKARGRNRAPQDRAQIWVEFGRFD
jgi:hypothetical protein